MSCDAIDVDIDALYRLKDAICNTSRDLEDVGQSIDSYLQGTIERLQRAVDFLRERLDEAQRRLDEAQEELSEAENDYKYCIDSQQEKTDEDGKTYYVPSCSFKLGRVRLCEKAVEEAKRVRNEWEKKVEDAERIKSDCEYEIERYNEMGGFIRPPGGKGVLYRLVHDHSDTASSKLDETIRALNDILTFSFETGESADSFDSFDPFDPSADRENSVDDVQVKEDKREQFEKASELLKEKYDDTAKPNVFEICTGCGKFKYINCDCARQNQRER